MSPAWKLHYRVARVSVFGALLGTMACGADALPPAEELEGGENVEPIARLSGSVADGRLTLAGVPLDWAGLTPQGFSTFSAGLVSFATVGTDGVGAGTCSATQYCATTAATNGTGRLMDNLFVEIASYDAVVPANAVVRLTNPVTLSDAFKSYMVNPTGTEGATWGTLAVGETKNVELKFNLNAGAAQATSFDFTADVYASFRRTANSGAIQTKRPAVNACNVSGSTNRLLGTDDAETNFELPFAFTLYDITYDRAVVSSNGYMLLYRTGTPAPTATLANGALNPATNPGLYVFWDDLSFAPGDGVCTVVSGTKPNRVFSATWKNARVSTSQPAKGTWSTETVTYSIVLNEVSDRFTFHYNLPAGGITNFTRGIGATIGVRATRSGGAIATAFTTNKVSPYIPALAADYGGAIVQAPGPVNP